MTAKVTPPQKLLKVVGQADGVEFDHSTCKLLDSTWMDISVDVALRMKKFDSIYNLAENIENLL